MAKRSRRLPGLIVRGVAWLLALTVLLVLPLRWLPPLTSSFMVQNWLAQASLKANVAYDWVPRTAISRQAALAVMASEDQKFLAHPGFDTGPSARPGSGMAAAGRFAALPRSASRSRRTSGSGPGAAGCARAWRPGSRCGWNCSGPRSGSWRSTSTSPSSGPMSSASRRAARQFFRKPAAALNGPEAALLAAVLPESPNLFKCRIPRATSKRRQAWIQRQARCPQRRAARKARWSGKR